MQTTLAETVSAHADGTPAIHSRLNDNFVLVECIMRLSKRDLIEVAARDCERAVFVRPHNQANAIVKPDAMGAYHSYKNANMVKFQFYNHPCFCHLLFEQKCAR